MTPAKLALLLSLAACVEAPDDTSELDQESHSTSAASLPNQIVLAKLDDTAATAMLQYSGNRLFANRADAAGTPILHHYFHTTVQQLIVGDFSLPGARESGRDQVCAKLADAMLYCYAPSDDRKELWYWFAQLYPLAAGEQPIVGDFTGDGADDILAFNSTTGSLRLFDRTATGLFAQRFFAFGNLSSYDLRGKKLFAGEFGLADRTDLLLVDPATGAVSRFDTATDSLGRTTFWWAFTTSANTIAATDQVTIANLEGGARDGLLVRSATGALRALRAEYASGGLAAIPATTLSLGQLPVTSQAGTFAAVRLVDHTAEGGANRDDILFFNRSTNTIVETSARHDGTRMTYWWGWSKPTPVAQPWVTRASKMALVYCKTADNDYEPKIAELNARISGVGTGSIRDFLFETSYGTIDLRNPDVFGWVQGTLNAADSSARLKKGGHKTQAYLDDCMAAAGIASADYQGRVFVILNTDEVARQGLIGYGATMEFDEILDGKLSFATHELLHAFGLGHAHDNSGDSCRGEYCDTTSIMGDYYTYGFDNAAGNFIGPGLNAMNLDKLGVVPPGRIVDLAGPSTSQTRTITLAALEHPEANGALYVKVRTSGSTYFTIALRAPAGYDRNLPIGVQIHDWNPAVTHTTSLHAYPRSDLQPGDIGVAGGYAVTVNAIDPVKKTATITLVH